MDSFSSNKINHHRNILLMMTFIPLITMAMTSTLFYLLNFKGNGANASGIGWSQNNSPVPLAAGTSAANITLKSGVQVMYRWTARHNGTLKTLHIHINSEGANCDQRRTGYGKGDGGHWVSTTHPVLPDGRPDTSKTYATQDFLPCSSSSLIDRQNAVAYLPMNFTTTKGQEYATVIRNTSSDANNNFISTNHLYTDEGLFGAQSRNERSPTATDAMYGLDPRELIGYSTNSGSSWSLPGGQYGGNGGKAFLPTYIQEYTDGFKDGQFYYYALPVPSGGPGETTSKTMVYQQIPVAWKVSQLGAYSNYSTSGTLTLYVNGVNKGSTAISGRGMLRGNLPNTVDIAPGSIVKVTSSGGLHLRRIIADNKWATIMGLGTSFRWYLEGNPQQAVPIYPIIQLGTTSPNPSPFPTPAPAPAPTPNPTTTNQVPYNSIIPIPGKIETENYDRGGEGVAYHDLNIQNKGGQYRTDAVDIENSGEGGYSVGWVNAGEWLEYTTNIAETAIYDITFRVATASTQSTSWTLKNDTTILATASTSNTGGWHAWKDIKISNVNLSSGLKILRLEAKSSDLNINWIKFEKRGSTVAIPNSSSSPDSNIPSEPLPPIAVPDANIETPVQIPDELPIENDGTITADFNGDGLNDIVKDTNNDGLIDPKKEIVIDGTTNHDLTDPSQSAISPEGYQRLLNKDIVTPNSNPDNSTVNINAGPIPDVKIPKPVAYSFLTAGTITLAGISTYLAITKLAKFAALRGKLGI